MVDEMERSMHDALCVVKRVLESKYFLGEYKWSVSDFPLISPKHRLFMGMLWPCIALLLL